MPQKYTIHINFKVIKQKSGFIKKTRFQIKLFKKDTLL
tara:strand:+ start:733 stop:846 length:114 start_codon:yes stop_codon:yes gene_type:complete